MEKRNRLEAAGIPVFFTEMHRSVAEAMAETVEKTALVLQNRWGLQSPANCEVHVLTDVSGFIEETAPRRLRLLVALAKPLWRGRAERAFQIAGGWMLPWPGRLAVGVKPPDLLAKSKTELGERLFKPVLDPLEKVRHITCHELTHAWTVHLRFPPWINEGLAMRAVDHMAGNPTVREETSTGATLDPSVLDSKAYRRVSPADHDALLALYSSGYWLTRRLEDHAPGILQELLKRKRPPREVAQIVTAALGSSTSPAGS